MTDERNGPFGGIRIGKGTKGFGENLTQCHCCVHNVPFCHKLSVEMNKVIILQLARFVTKEHIVAPGHTRCLKMTVLKK
jgi:hypothetical protein